MIAGMASRTCGRLGAGAPHHGRQNDRIEHALHGDSLGGGFEAGDAADALHQRVAVVRAGTPGERAVDIEEDQRFVAQ
jgi:hypothetical protein